MILKEFICIIVQRTSIRHLQKARFLTKSFWFFIKKLFYPPHMICINGSCLNSLSVWRTPVHTLEQTYCNVSTMANTKSCWKTPGTRLYTCTRLGWPNIQYASRLLVNCWEFSLQLGFHTKSYLVTYNWSWKQWRNSSQYVQARLKFAIYYLDVFEEDWKNGVWTDKTKI